MAFELYTHFKTYRFIRGIFKRSTNSSGPVYRFTLVTRN